MNGALKAEIAVIHAWTPKCYTPEEWEKKDRTGDKNLEGTKVEGIKEVGGELGA